MTSRFAVGSVSTLAMGALLLGSASFWLNRPGTSAHAAPWGDISSFSPASSSTAQADDKTELLKLAALKSGTDAAATTAPAPSSPVSQSSAAAPAAAPSAATQPAAIPAMPEGTQSTAASAVPAAVAPAVQMASTEDQAPAEASAPADDTPAVKSNLIDLNTASADSFDHMGAGRVGRAIVSHRPYRSVKDLVSKRVLRTSDYQKIESRVRVD